MSSSKYANTLSSIRRMIVSRGASRSIFKQLLSGFSCLTSVSGDSVSIVRTTKENCFKTDLFESFVRTIMVYKGAAVKSFIAGFRDALWPGAFIYVITSPLIRRRFFQCVVLNGIIFVGSIIALNYIIIPLFVLILQFAGFTSTSTEWAEFAVDKLYKVKYNNKKKKNTFIHVSIVSTIFKYHYNPRHNILAPYIYFNTVRQFGFYLCIYSLLW